jgi:uncharacterized membrane protein
MATLREARSLGAVGSILIMGGIIQPGLVLFLGIIGFFFLLRGASYIEKITGARDLSGNLDIATTIVIFAGLLGFFFLVPAFVSLLGAVFTTPGQSLQSFYDTVLAAVFYLVVVWVLTIFAAVYLRRVCDSLASIFRVDLFYLAGTLFLVGAALTIVIVGWVIVLAALALLAAAFLSIPDEVPPRPHYTILPRRDTPAGK